ncbi:hypothetical protein [Rhizobium sp. Leaf453]|uniref:hypothetical protein n=1 Tax=Rhizobium sp. Leaf453 TaxID=1736380 RepID=UPI0012E3C8FD|nr:hypothetical protein [Rhizobium sp. Leaf453]
MAHLDSREGPRISFFRPPMSRIHLAMRGFFTRASDCPQAASRSCQSPERLAAKEPNYMPIMMMEKLAMNIATEVKAARSRIKSVIAGLLFRYVPLMFYLCSLVKQQIRTDGCVAGQMVNKFQRAPTAG